MQMVRKGWPSAIDAASSAEWQLVEGWAAERGCHRYARLVSANRAEQQPAWVAL